jgi:lysophospholipase L1-like esterase
MAYSNPTHCRIFGRPGFFPDDLQTAASGMTAEWGLKGDNGWGGVVNLRYPRTYVDVDGGRSPIGKRQAYPELATIMFGTNDLRNYVTRVRAWDASPAAERKNRAAFVRDMGAIAQWFTKQGVVPLLLTMPPGTYEAWSVKVGNETLGPLWVEDVRKLGREIHVPVFDVNRLVLDQESWESLLADGVHINERGYEIINEKFYEVYTELKRRVLVRRQ